MTPPKDASGSAKTTVIAASVTKAIMMKATGDPRPRDSPVKTEDGVHPHLNLAPPPSIHAHLNSSPPPSIHAHLEGSPPPSIHAHLEESTPPSIHAHLAESAPPSSHAHLAESAPPSIHAHLEVDATRVSSKKVGQKNIRE